MTKKEYMELEELFANTPGALCENVSPALCDCSKCPLRVMCETLCSAEVSQ